MSRKRHRGEFAIVPIAALQLPPAVVAVLVALASVKSGRGGRWTTMSTLARLARVHRNTARTAIMILQAAGHVLVVESNGRHRFAAKINHSDKWVAVPVVVARDPQMTHAALKAFAAALSFRHHTSGQCNPSHDLIAGRAAMTADAVGDALRIARRCGHVVAQQRWHDAAPSSNDYRFPHLEGDPFGDLVEARQVRLSGAAKRAVALTVWQQAFDQSAPLEAPFPEEAPDEDVGMIAPVSRPMAAVLGEMTVDDAATVEHAELPVWAEPVLRRAEAPDVPRVDDPFGDFSSVDVEVLEDGFRVSGGAEAPVTVEPEPMATDVASETAATIVTADAADPNDPHEGEVAGAQEPTVVRLPHTREPEAVESIPNAKPRVIFSVADEHQPGLVTGKPACEGWTEEKMERQISLCCRGMARAHRETTGIPIDFADDPTEHAAMRELLESMDVLTLVKTVSEAPRRPDMLRLGFFRPTAIAADLPGFIAQLKIPRESAAPASR